MFNARLKFGIFESEGLTYEPRLRYHIFDELPLGWTLATADGLHVPGPPGQRVSIFRGPRSAVLGVERLKALAVLEVPGLPEVSVCDLLNAMGDICRDFCQKPVAYIHAEELVLCTP